MSVPSEVQLATLPRGVLKAEKESSEVRKEYDVRRHVKRDTRQKRRRELRGMQSISEYQITKETYYIKNDLLYIKRDLFTPSYLRYAK